MAEPVILPFEPAASQVLALSTSSDRAALATRAGSRRQALLTNVSTTINVFAAFGGATVTASATASMIVPPSGSRLVTIPDGATYIAGIAASGTPSLYITEGYGG
jgi:hypothetical protein